MTYDEVCALERVEIEAFSALYRSVGPETVEAVGLSVAEVGGGVLFTARHLDVLALNRLLGLGLDGPVSGDDFDSALECIAQSGAARCFIPVAPVEPVAPAGGLFDIARSLEARGVRHYNNWVRLSRALVDLPEQPATTLVVREIDASLAAPFGQIVATAFGYPPALAPLAVAGVGRPGWRHYLAYFDGTPVAAAGMYLSGSTAWFGLAATDASHRRLGAQQALLVRRLHDAAAAGCSLVSVETAEDSVVKDAPSFRNLRRLGFAVAYVRPNYLWSAAPDKGDAARR